MAFNCNVTIFTAFLPIMPTAEAQKQHIPIKKIKSIEMELLINSNSLEILLTIAIVISILLISSATHLAAKSILELTHPTTRTVIDTLSANRNLCDSGTKVSK